MSDEQFRKDALEYHAANPPGKIRVVPTKPHSTQRELSLAYSPGVAYPCLEIEKDPTKAMEYTSRGNLVAVISNGTAVLGLGNIGALAGKPVMEGKGLLFTAFADIAVFDTPSRARAGKLFFCEFGLGVDCCSSCEEYSGVLVAQDIAGPLWTLPWIMCS